MQQWHSDDLPNCLLECPRHHHRGAIVQLLVLLGEGAEANVAWLSAPLPEDPVPTRLHAMMDADGRLLVDLSSVTGCTI